MITIEKRMEELRKEWLADGETDFTDDDLLEAIKAEDNYKDMNKYTKSAEIKPKSERKAPKKIVSAEKQTLFKEISEFLLTKYGENAIIVKENKEMNIKINDKSFKIDVVEHRKGKK